MISSILTDTRLLSKATSSLARHETFSIEPKNSGVGFQIVYNNDPSRRIQTAKNLVDWAAAAIKQPQSFDPSQVKKLVSAAYAYAKKCLKGINVESSAIESLRHRSVGLLLGVDTDVRPLSSDYVQFILANHLHHQYHAFDLPVKLNESGPILRVDGERVCFSALTKTKRFDGFEFSIGARRLFTTDKNLKLTNRHFLPVKGIVPGSTTSNRKPPVFEKNDPTGECWVELISYVEDTFCPQLHGDHTVMVLENAAGERVIWGLYGKNCTFLIPFSAGTGTINSPDRFYGRPETDYFIKTFRKKLSAEQFDALQADLKRDLQGVSLLRRNCTGIPIEKLKAVGVEVDAKMSIISFLARKALSFILPRAAIKWIKKTVRKLEIPEWAKKALHFFPPYYILHLISALFCGIFGALYPTHGDPDYNLVDIFFRPWNVYINHPVALREWQKVHQNSQPQEV